MPKYILLLALLTLVLTTPHQASAEAPPSADVVVFIFGMSDSNRDGYVSWSRQGLLIAASPKANLT